MSQNRAHPGRIALTVVIPHRRSEPVKPVLERLKKSVPPGIRYQVVSVSGDQPSVQRNLAVRRARGAVIYFIDNDSFVVPGSVELGLSLFRNDQKIAVAGGPSITPRSDTFSQKCFGLALSSLFAVGPGIRSRYTPSGKPRRTGEFELILCNMFVRTDVFRKAGGFDERLYPNEENAFINTVKKRGYDVFYHPDIRVERGQRRGLGQFIRQMLTYGRGRAEQSFFQSSSFNLSLLIPVVFALYLAALAPVFFLLPAGDARLVWLGPAIFHLLLDVVFAIEAGIRGRNPLVLPVMPFLFIVVHLFYGLGMIAGTLRLLAGFGKRVKEKGYSARIDHESVH